MHSHQRYSPFAHLLTSEPQTHRQPSADCFSIENHVVWTLHSDSEKEAIIPLQVMSLMLVRSLLGWQPWQLQTACNMWTGIYCAGGKPSPLLAAAAAIVLFYQRGLPCCSYTQLQVLATICVIDKAQRLPCQVAF